MILCLKGFQFNISSSMQFKGTNIKVSILVQSNTIQNQNTNSINILNVFWLMPRILGLNLTLPLVRTKYSTIRIIWIIESRNPEFNWSWCFESRNVNISKAWSFFFIVINHFYFYCAILIKLIWQEFQKETRTTSI